MDDHQILKREIRDIAISDINNEDNVRVEGVLKNLEELKTSIKRIGLIHPIVVEETKDKRYNLLAGQRRVKAYEQLGQKKIPAIIVNHLDDISKKIVSFTENIHRSSLSFGDTVRVCDELFNNYKGTDNQKIDKMAKEIGVSINTIMRYLSFRLIPKKVQQMVEDKKISASQAYKITQAFWPNTDKIEKIAEYTSQIPKQTWERALDIGKKNPKTPVDEILKEALNAPDTFKVSLEIDKDNFKQLAEEAKKRGERQKRTITVEELIKDLIDQFISNGG